MRLDVEIALDAAFLAAGRFMHRSCHIFGFVSLGKTQFDPTFDQATRHCTCVNQCPCPLPGFRNWAYSFHAI